MTAPFTRTQRGPCPVCQGQDRFYLIPRPRNGGAPFWLCNRCHHTVSADAADLDRLSVTSEIRELTAEERADVIVCYTVAADYCAPQLFTEGGQEAHAYLRRRGLSDDSLRELRIGYHPHVVGSQGLGDHLWRHNKRAYDAGRIAGLLGPQGKSKQILQHAITIPYWSTEGCVLLRSRSCDPGTGPKYRSPAGLPLFSGAPPTLYLSQYLDQTDRVILTEGEFKAILAWQAWRAGDLSLPAVGQPSIGYLPDAMLDQLAGKVVYLCYDAERRTDPFVLSPGESYTISAGERITGLAYQRRIDQLQQKLSNKKSPIDDEERSGIEQEVCNLQQRLSICQARAIRLHVLRLPRDPDVAKVDLDEFLLTHGPAALDRLVATAPTFAEWHHRHGASAYTYRHGEIWNGHQLANYAAVIAEDQTLDDGMNQTAMHKFAMVAPSGARREATIPADVWADDRKARQALRAAMHEGTADDEGPDVLKAIKALSLRGDGPARRTIYTATGWQEIRGEWAYLMPDGAITARGPSQTIRAVIDAGVTGNNYAMCGPGDRDQGARAFVAFLRGSVCAQPVALLLAAHAVLPLIHRFLGKNDRPMVWLYGETGSLKTSLARAILALYGPAFTGSRGGGGAVPKWEATAVGLEQIAYTYRDTLVPFDDYKQSTTRPGLLASFLHAYGEGAGRARGTFDKGQGVKAAKATPPRCIAIGTGEDRPVADPGQLARVLLVPLLPGAINADALATLQQAGESGALSAFWRGFVQQVAVKLDQHDGPHKLGEYLRALLAADDAALPGHKRTAGALHQNRVAFLLLTTWLQRAGYITASEREQFNAAHLDARQIVAQEQQHVQEDERAGNLFLAWLSERLLTGELVIERNESKKDRLARMDRDEDEQQEVPPRPEQIIGFDLGEEMIAIHPTKAMELFQKSRIRDKVEYSSAMVWQQLHAAGALAVRDEKENKNPVQQYHKPSGKSPRVLVLWRSALHTNLTPLHHLTPHTNQGVRSDSPHHEPMDADHLTPLHLDYEGVSMNGEGAGIYSHDSSVYTPSDQLGCKVEDDDDLGDQKAINSLTPRTCKETDHPFGNVNMSHVQTLLSYGNLDAISKHCDFHHQPIDEVIAYAQALPRIQRSGVATPPEVR